MKNVISIFKADFKGLTKNFFALVIAIGLCFLPALYAWFNIYANWDPYANTGNIKIAVVNLDEGLERGGEMINMGDSIVESLKEKDSIGWQFLEDEMDAKNGVKSGEYYAAIVIDKDFSYGMYHGVAENVENPKLTYYVNDKKNAVATKITDTAVSTVQASVNKQFLKVLVEKMFEETNSLSSDMTDEELVEEFVVKMENVSAKLKEYSALIDTMQKANGNMSFVSEGASGSMLESQEKLQEGIDKLESGQGNLDKTQLTFNEYSVKVNNTLNQIETSLKKVSTQLGAAGLETDVNALQTDMDAILATSNTLAGQLSDLLDELEQLQSNGASAATIAIVKANIDALQTAISQAQNLSATVSVAENTLTAINAIQNQLTSLSQTVSNLNKMYNNQIVPQVNTMLSGMKETLESVQQMLTSLKSTTGTMSEVFAGAATTLDTLNISLGELQVVLNDATERLDEVLEKIDAADAEEKISVILNVMSSNPQKIGTFFSEPVQASENYIYEIKNYGSGVAPFYTTLAIWVGMTILVSMIKVHADTNNLENVKPSELFFGRYILIFLLSQIQALIIVLGDLFLLRIQCVHPIAFWAAAAMASLTFSLLIYSLTIAFGDIGKAIAVVVMVVQIAGSGGTYPIEALPKFFQAVYIFFPFPYAINAMRECVGGMYETAFSVYLLQLAAFAVAALVIGLVIRIPFIKLNHFIEERMEDTEML